MAYGRLNYQFSGTPKPPACASCQGKGNVMGPGGRGICIECHGSGIATHQMRIKICNVQKMYTGRRGRHSIVAYTMTDGGYYKLNQDFPWDGIPPGLIEKIRAAGSIDPKFWTHVKPLRKQA